MGRAGKAGSIEAHAGKCSRNGLYCCDCRELLHFIVDIVFVHKIFGGCCRGLCKGVTQCIRFQNSSTHYC